MKEFAAILLLLLGVGFLISRLPNRAPSPPAAGALVRDPVTVTDRPIDLDLDAIEDPDWREHGRQLLEAHDSARLELQQAKRDALAASETYQELSRRTPPYPSDPAATAIPAVALSTAAPPDPTASTGPSAGAAPRPCARRPARHFTRSPRRRTGRVSRPARPGPARGRHLAPR